MTSNHWVTPHGSLDVQHGEIHVWRADLDRNVSSLAALDQTLAPDERRKAGGFRLELDRNRYIIARAALRTILARYLKATPGELVLCRGAQGKPEHAGGGVRFNVSHSQGLALYAISRACDVGVDIERVRPGIDEDVARCFFSRRAICFLKALPPLARRRAFFQGWTRMEAYLKARGEGLAASELQISEVFLGPSRAALGSAPDNSCAASGWWFYDLLPGKGYVATLAARSEKCRLRYWKWQALLLGNR